MAPSLAQLFPPTACQRARVPSNETPKERLERLRTETEAVIRRAEDIVRASKELLAQLEEQRIERLSPEPERLPEEPFVWLSLDEFRAPGSNPRNFIRCRTR